MRRFGKELLPLIDVNNCKLLVSAQLSLNGWISLKIILYMTISEYRLNTKSDVMLQFGQKLWHLIE